MNNTQGVIIQLIAWIMYKQGVKEQNFFFPGLYKLNIIVFIIEEISNTCLNFDVS